MPLNSAQAVNPVLPAALVAIGVFLGAAATHLLTVGCVEDLRKLVRQYRHDARHDPLTGLPNRTVAMKTLITDAPSMIGLCDLNDFKNINDRHGHAVGDELLRHVAQQLQTAITATGTGIACRLAGDEFVLLWRRRPAHPLTEATRLADAMSAPLVIDGHTIQPSIALGLALASPSLTGTDLLAAADDALYDAKQHNETVALYRRKVPPGPIDRNTTGRDRRTRSRRNP